jgi:hypothetical protein
MVKLLHRIPVEVEPIDPNRLEVLKFDYEIFPAYERYRRAKDFVWKPETTKLAIFFRDSQLDQTTLELLDVDTWSLTQVLDVVEYRRFAFNEDGRRLAIADYHDVITVFDDVSGKSSFGGSIFGDIANTVELVWLSPSVIYFSSRDWTWDVENSALRKLPHSENPLSFGYIPKEIGGLSWHTFMEYGSNRYTVNRMAGLTAWGDRKIISIHDKRDPERIDTIEVSTNVSCLYWYSDKHLTVGFANGSMAIINVQTKAVQEYRLFDESRDYLASIDRVALHPSGTLVAASTAEELAIFDLRAE